MPMPGDQHRDTPATTNPFAEQKPPITPFTAQQIATLQSRLDKQLGPEYISTRPGAGGGKVHYLAAEKVINLANEVFGFNGWSSSIQNVQVDFVDEHKDHGKITLGLSTIVRVTLRDGTFHEDIGYGHIENCKGKAAAFEKAKKEAATDAMKRALRNFGNVLGNCLYDKEYLQKVTKVKIAPTKWDADNLHRHPDYAPIKREAIADVEMPQRDPDKRSAAQQRQSSVQSAASHASTEFEEDFGGNPFDETDFLHPDEVRLDETRNAVDTSAKNAVNVAPNAAAQQRQGVQRMQSLPQIPPPNVQPPQAVQNPLPPQRPPGPSRPPMNPAQAQGNRAAPPLAGSNLQRTAQSPAAPAQTYSANLSSDAVMTNDSTSTSNNMQQQQQQQQRQTNPHPSHNPPHPEQPAAQSLPTPRIPPPDIPEGFITGRGAELLNQPPGGVRPPHASLLAFNPHAESPSIRRTHGVNPGRSAPVTRLSVNGMTSAATTTSGVNGQHHNNHHHHQQQQATAIPPTAGAQQPPPPPPQQQQQQHPPAPPQPQAMQTNSLNGTTAPIRTNFVNPSADTNRKIGMPPSAASHSHTIHQNQNQNPNRASFKPQTPMKRSRPPLSDVSNFQQLEGGCCSGGAKKAKLDDDDDDAAAAVLAGDGGAGNGVMVAAAAAGVGGGGETT